MDNSLFDDLVSSIKEAGAIKRKEIQASQTTQLELPDVKEVREKMGLSQVEFAARLHMSARTLQNWEQPHWPSSDFNSHSRCTPQPDLKDTSNKKAQHPVGLFYIFDAFGITPVVPLTFLVLSFFLFSGASCSLCPHDRKLLRSRIAAKSRD